MWSKIWSYSGSLKGLGHAILGNFSTDQMVIEFLDVIWFHVEMNFFQSEKASIQDSMVAKLTVFL